MQARELLDAMAVAQRLKDTTRHCYTPNGRHESVAEHCWMATLMAFLLRGEFPQADMDKVIRMLIIHDLGECFTGDIPTFDKSQAHERAEEAMLDNWLGTLPAETAAELRALYTEMAALESTEAKIYKAIDNLEAVIQHNNADLSTWIPLEYELQLTYGNDKVAFSPYLTQLRQVVREDSLKKIEAGKHQYPIQKGEKRYEA